MTPSVKRSRNWTAIFLVVPIALLWVSLTVRSTELSYDIQRLEEDIRRENRRRIELEMSVDRRLSLEAVEAAAKDKLGFVVPQEKDVVVVAVPRP